MAEKMEPGRTAYATFCGSLGIADTWTTLPDRTRTAWFAVEARCAWLPHQPASLDDLADIAAAIEDPGTSRRNRKLLRNVFSILSKGLPLESQPAAPRGAPPLAYIPIMPGVLDAGPRQSVIPAEMEHLDRALMVGGAVLEPGGDDSYIRSRLAGGDPAKAPLFQHVVGFPPLHVRQKRVDAEVAMDRMTTIAVDMGEHPISGRYLVSEAALRMMEQGEVVELVREPGSYSIDAAPIGGRGILPSALADQVRATLEGYLADLKTSPGVILSNLEPLPPLKTITLSAEGRAYVDRAMASLAADLSAEEQPAAEAGGPAVTAEVAKSMGATFTGNSCDFCASFAMVRTGKCDTCQECGRTGGCG